MEHRAAKDECPQECTDEEQECWVTDFDAKGTYGQSASTAKRQGVLNFWLVLVLAACPGNWLSAKDKCAPKGQECPCGENSVRCALAQKSTLCL